MHDPHDSNFDIVQTERDELVRRLRELQWPTVRDDVRERCWAAFNARLAERLGPPNDELHPRRNAGSRLEYRRRASVPNVPPALISSGRRAWAARPQRRLSSRVA